jgi:TolB-like protein/Tfp pilus assembly protein PilF
MKKCPQCGREYDNSMGFCLDDGAELLYGPGLGEEPATAIIHHTAGGGEAGTRAQTYDTERTSILPRSDADAARSSSFDRRLLIAPLALVMIALGGFFGYRYLSQTKQIQSIAVMPFVNESGNSDVDYLSDGITETLISSLTKVPNLNVKARSSVFRYKGRDTDAKTIGQELGVQAVLSGRIAQRGDQMNLSLELVDVATENAIWSQQYTRKQSDLVSLQSEIARDVSANLRSKLSGTDSATIAKTYTADPEAYQLYLKGRYQWNKRTSESLKQAVSFFEQAVARDPNYALAYSGLAESYVLFPNYSVALPMECMPKAKAAALRAIELDDSRAETHTALGIYYSEFAWNQPAAEKEFRRAIELNPNYAAARQQFGIECLTPQGRFDEAIAEGKRAAELDPASPIIAADLGNAMYKARRFDDALAQLNKAAALDQNFSVTNWYIGQVLHEKGRYAEAVAAYRKALAADGNPWVKALLIRSLARLGQRGEAVKLLNEVQAEAANRVVSSASFAIAYGALGEKDKAFAFLDKEIAERNGRCPLFAVTPVFDDLRDDPRFAELIKRVDASRID